MTPPRHSSDNEVFFSENLERNEVSMNNMKSSGSVADRRHRKMFLFKRR